jgi:putative ABC transport system ATP-binding protein
VLERLHDDGITLLIVTHDPEIGRRAHRRLRMADGALAADEAGTPADPAHGAGR